jgi:hypothetical protein
MAFGYRYWMVHLPEFEGDSYLLFVHNPTGSTKLRSYSSGREHVLGQPPVETVFRQTTVGLNRHEVDPHKTDDHGFWWQKTLEMNRRYLQSGPSRGQASSPAVRNLPRRSGVVAGRAARGSQRQIQEYVNHRPDVLSAAVLNAMPDALRESGARIQWVSPLAREDYREYRDAEFLERIGLSDFAEELADFWPSMGPSWDALGVLSAPGLNRRPVAILVEAKSHIREIYGNGCLASGASLAKIQAAMEEARTWCGSPASGEWLGPLYQSANRIAHLFLLLKKLRAPAWLVNLYLLDDPIGPATRADWEREVTMVKAQLGLTKPVPNMIEVYLPALEEATAAIAAADTPLVPPRVESAEFAEAGPGPGPLDLPLDVWMRRWMDLAEFHGPHLPDPERRIREVLELWDLPVPGMWERGVDPQLLGARYRRGDILAPRAGEHTIEHEILNSLDDVRCFGGRLIDGVNAMPFIRDSRGGRHNNVEGDLFLLAEQSGAYRLLICEVKDSSDTCWYAAVENLRQLRLLHDGSVARRLFHDRVKHLTLAEELPLTALVIAPALYYSQPGKKGNATRHATRLLREFTAKTGIAAHLAVWDASSKTILEWKAVR